MKKCGMEAMESTYAFKNDLEPMINMDAIDTRRKKNKKNDPMTEDVTMMRMRRRIAVVIVAEMTAPTTEEIAPMIEETVLTIDGGMMIVDIIAEIVHVALMTEGGEETTTTIADPDTMMMTVTDAIDAILVPGTDILLLDPTLVSAVDTSLDYFQPQSDYEKSDCDCREGSIKELLVRCYI